jgi:hypothetical protein
VKIKCSLTPSSIDAAIKQLEDYSKDLDRKLNELAQRLASMGATEVSLGFSRAIYTGPMDYDVAVEDIGNNKYRILVSGEAILFAEFGSGITYGKGHPLDNQFGYGPGTYPGQTHAMTGKGWYLPKDKGGGHTYGNPPNMPMYNTAKDLRKEIMNVAREVFKT